MKIKDHIGEPAAVEAIEAFEKRHDIRLPDDYRTFLASHNGGRPEMASRVFTFQKEDGSISDSLVDWFSGLIESVDYSLEEEGLREFPWDFMWDWEASILCKTR